MRNPSICVFAALSCLACLTMPMTAADEPSPTTSRAKQVNGARHQWPAETMTGKITQVEPDHHLLIVESSDKVPFDLIITAKTRITAPARAVSMGDLVKDQGRTVTIQFIPERRGDVAVSIHISG